MIEISTTIWIQPNIGADRFKGQIGQPISLKIEAGNTRIAYRLEGSDHAHLGILPTSWRRLLTRAFIRSGSLRAAVHGVDAQCGDSILLLHPTAPRFLCFQPIPVIRLLYFDEAPGNQEI